MTIEADVCLRCEGKGTVPLQVHATDCSPLRCSKDCPRTIPAKCPACAKAELGDDLS